MFNYLFGAATAATVFTMMNVIDANVPNNLWYYVDLYMPF